jgi:hypothetical protein
MRLEKMTATSLRALASLGAANAADFPVKAVSPIPDLPFFQVNDNRLSYSYIFQRHRSGRHREHCETGWVTVKF